MMNLKFWKKTPSQEEAEDIPDSPGLFARVKARVGSLTGRLKSPPPFQAEVTDEVDASDSAPADTDADAPESAIKSGALARAQAAIQRVKAAAAPGSSSRTKLFIGASVLLLTLLSALSFAVWNIFLSSPNHDAAPLKSASDQRAIAPSRPIATPATPAPSAASAVADATPTSSPVETSTATPLDILEQKKAQLQIQLDSLKPEHASAPVMTEHLSETTASDHKAAASAVPVATSHSKSAASSVSPSSPQISAEPSAANATDETPETEIVKLRREKAELQKKLNELRNEKRRTTTTRRPQAGQTPSLGGSVTVPSNDPKATADTLKTAIDAMNAGTGDYQKKPAK